MAKYAEVREKQKNVDKVKEKEEKFARGVWVGFTFKTKDAEGFKSAAGEREEEEEGEEEGEGEELETLF